MNGLRFKRCFYCLAVCVWLSQGFPLPAQSAEVLERILAVVNDEIVTEQDIQLVMAPVIAQYRTQLTGKELEEKTEEIRRQFLAKVIEDKLILSEAKRLQVIIKPEEVDEMLEEVQEKFPDRDTYLQAIDEQGLTERKLRERFENQLRTQRLVDYQVKSRVSVSPGQVNEYYKENQKDFKRGERVRLKHILVRIGPRTEDEARIFADSLIAKINQGQSFESLASDFSESSEAADGGEMGWMERGQLMGNIDAQVFKLKANEVTPPIKTTLGYHIFKVVEKEEASAKPFDEVKGKIHKILFKQEMEKRLDDWIGKLRENAYISIR